ncbi:MAG: GGDEF domain-containing phosphodiesterase [Alcaligenaceae bacterium]|nr:GGDEF domain-containing phosphodiesterase [Alcaligenaceae bacterium]
MGITLFGGQPESIEEPLKRADMAMHQAKASGRNRVQFFDPQMQAQVRAHMELEGALRVAVERSQFSLYYQPQVDDTGHITGAEVLLRWRHPVKGMISPARFIPLAEETGLIVPLGRWVLEAACTQLAAWAADPHLSQLSLSVNVSATQIRQDSFVSDVFRILDDTGADPRRLNLELTESSLVTEVESVIAKMAALKARGVGFSLDDFGTGYSSLAYLKRLPLDQLKIDQGFVRDILIDPNDAAIAKMTILLAGSLGISVVAEGVETEAQRQFLAKHGCHGYQGYLFGAPMPLEEFEHLFSTAFSH